MNTKVKAVGLLFGTLLAANPAVAGAKIGEIGCSVISEPELSEPDLSITADIFGNEVEGEVRTTSIDLQLLSSDSSTMETKVLKSWDQVPVANSGFFSLAFRNDAVRFEAYFDDVGAMSELSYDDQVLQLQCDIDYID